MKKLFIVFVLLLGYTSLSQDLSPFIKVGDTEGTIQQVSLNVIDALKTNSFTVLGAYHPEGKANLKVIAFTRSDIKNTVVKIKDRGALAAVFRIGLLQKNGKITISYTNPEYIFRAYLRGNYATYKVVFNKFSKDLKTALEILGKDFTPFGGKVNTNELKKYHYKIMMPYFTDPVILNEYASFDEGLAKIETNLKAHKGQTVKVYKVVYKSKQVAIFGVGLKSKVDGETVFLPKIGESHLAALPYEIILQGNKATMLHGKYRIALFWPELTMGTFMRIMSTPGDIEDTLKQLCQ